jgi:hypothetical protein
VSAAPQPAERDRLRLRVAADRRRRLLPVRVERLADLRTLAAIAIAATLLGGTAAASGASPRVARDDPGGNTWTANATSFRGNNGARYVFTCPSYGTASNIWGTDVYTDDSSVCTAAVHTGQLTLAGGGTVTIEIRPGQSSYTGSTRNGITSQSYGSWVGSFVIVSVTASPPGVGTGGSTWDAKATDFRPYIGARFVYTCPANGTPFNIWGTDVYTDDSSVCTAAVHVGLITFASGGSVTIEMRAGQSSYAASTRNGVTSTAYGSWLGSFVFLGTAAPGGGTIGSPNPPPPPKPSVAVNVGGSTGTVLVKLPGQTSFATLQGNAQIPVGAQVDTTKGSVALTSAEGTATFKDGAFVVREPAAPAPTRITQLVLTGGDFGTCPKSKRRSAAASPKIIRHLWGSGKGRFQTQGRFAAATVRGTDWEVQDRCDGTRVVVRTGVVTVRDLKRGRNLIVTAGHSVLVKP